MTLRIRASLYKDIFNWEPGKHTPVYQRFVTYNNASKDRRFDSPLYDEEIAAIATHYGATSITFEEWAEPKFSVLSCIFFLHFDGERPDEMGLVNVVFEEKYW